MTLTGPECRHVRGTHDANYKSNGIAIVTRPVKPTRPDASLRYDFLSPTAISALTLSAGEDNFPLMGSGILNSIISNDGECSDSMQDFTSSVGSTIEEKVAMCQQRIGYVFKDHSLAVSALTHASGASSRLQSNERLEFLGDAILGFTICDWLYAQHPEYLEGELTQVKSAVVSRRCCAKVSRRLGLEACLILGKGMQTATGVPKSLLSDVFEALIAAIFLDGGIEPARNFVLQTMADELKQAVQGHSIGNYKSALQHLAQRQHGVAPNYHLVSERGPDHSKAFQIVAVLGKTRFTPAWGRNKKDAEQRAAANALAELQGTEPPFPTLEG